MVTQFKYTDLLYRCKCSLAMLNSRNVRNLFEIYTALKQILLYNTTVSKWLVWISHSNKSEFFFFELEILLNGIILLQQPVTDMGQDVFPHFLTGQQLLHFHDTKYLFKEFGVSKKNESLFYNND